MSRLDIIIFGATGFTGKHAVKELSRIAKTGSNLTWGVAGRSQDKLEKMLKEISKKTEDDLSSVKIIIADVSDEKSLKDMCAQARVLVNCCGPYKHYGEPVVRAAIDNKTHYVDVSGEPHFIETMQLEYDQQARDAGVYIISACGFDCIPNDMGVIFLQQNFGGTVNSVESYLSTKMPPNAKNGVINYGTWESLIYSLANHNELHALRKKLYPERLPTFKPKLKQRSLLHKRDESWCVPFLGADASVVYRTQRFLYESEHKRPVQMKAYVKFPSFLSTIAISFAAVMLYVLTKFGFTRNLLLKYPALFSLGMISKDGPSEEVITGTQFNFELFGEGWEAGSDVDATPPNKKVTVKVSGTNPGYGATVVALLYSALTIIREKDKMPEQGGVMTTGAAFRNTSIIKHLNENNLKFEIVENK